MWAAFCGEYFDAGLGYADVVFYSDSSYVGEVDAGFDGEDHVFLERILVSLGESSAVVDGESEAMSG